MDCVFCKIVSGEIPAQIVARTDGAVAFADNNPQAPTHVLVVPVEHVANASELGPNHGQLLTDLFKVANQVADEAGLTNGYRLVFNVGDDAGNSVPHLHLHVLGGRSLSWPPG